MNEAEAARLQLVLRDWKCIAYNGTYSQGLYSRPTDWLNAMQLEVEVGWVRWRARGSVSDVTNGGADSRLWV